VAGRSDTLQKVFLYNYHVILLLLFVLHLVLEVFELYTVLNNVRKNGNDEMIWVSNINKDLTTTLLYYMGFLLYPYICVVLSLGMGLLKKPQLVARVASKRCDIPVVY
jgi:hypothetical protein